MGFGRGKGFTQDVKATVGAILSKAVSGTSKSLSTSGKLSATKTTSVT